MSEDDTGYTEASWDGSDVRREFYSMDSLLTGGVLGEGMLGDAEFVGTTRVPYDLNLWSLASQARRFIQLEDDHSLLLSDPVRPLLANNSTSIYVARAMVHASDASPIIKYQGTSASEEIDPDAADRIMRLSRLQADWDGHGGEPISQEAVRAARFFLYLSRKLTLGESEGPFIAPLPDGGIDLEWDLESGRELTLIVRSFSDVMYLLDVPTEEGAIEQSEGRVPQDASLSELLARLF